MALMPGAAWRPLASNWASQGRLTTPDLICIHTMVGSLVGTESYFRSGNGAGFAGTESHFGTGYDGEIRQWQDTAYRADANLNGNHRIISIENADYGPGFPAWNLNDGGQVPAFTPAQAEANAQILAWAHRVHGIPLVLVPDSKPGRRGVCYHRQGCDPYRVAGGEKWSNAYGKVCPGNRRIAQIPSIIARARQIVGASVPEEDMPSAEEIAKATVAELMRADASGNPGVQPFKDVISQTWSGVNQYLKAELVANRVVVSELAKVVADQEGFDALEIEQAVSRAVDAALTGKLVRAEVTGFTLDQG